MVDLSIENGGSVHSYLVGGAITILQNMSSSMGRMTSHILWKIKTVWNHQPPRDDNQSPFLEGHRSSLMVLLANHGPTCQPYFPQHPPCQNSSQCDGYLTTLDSGREPGSCCSPNKRRLFFAGNSWRVGGYPKTYLASVLGMYLNILNDRCISFLGARLLNPWIS